MISNILSAEKGIIICLIKGKVEESEQRRMNLAGVPSMMGKEDGFGFGVKEESRDHTLPAGDCAAFTVESPVSCGSFKSRCKSSLLCSG